MVVASARAAVTVAPAEEPGTRILPLAMAAVTVAGQCRERSPADLAIFGAGAVRFAERFVEAKHGEAVLAEALAAGGAECAAELRTGSGSAHFRVALWRQRGGDRIRLLASFAHAPAVAPVDGQPAIPTRAVERFGAAMRLPLFALTELAERVRTGAPAEAGALAQQAGDMLSAAWRMTRLVDDLSLLGRLGIASAPLRTSEIDLLRLARRVVRLTEPVATAAGVSLSLEDGAAPLPGLIADETTLWSLLEGLVGAAVAQAGQGGGVAVRCRVVPESGDLELAVQRRGKGVSSVPEPLPALLSELAAENGARLEEAPGGLGPLARLSFPKRRCLSPV